MKMKDKDTLTKQEAKDLVVKREDNMVHTFINNPFGLIGADHTLESIYEDIDNSYMCKRTGKMAEGTGHGLVIIPTEKCKQHELLFVETKDGIKFNEELSGV